MNMIYNLGELIKNTHENNSWSLFHQSIMNDYHNLPLNLIKVLGEKNATIHQNNIDIYNKYVFSIKYNHSYFIIIPDNECYGHNYDMKLFIIVSFKSIYDYNKAINNYYSNFN